MSTERSKSGLFRLVFAFSWTYWRRQPARIAAMGFFMLLATGTEAFTPLLFGRLIDSIGAGDKQGAVHAVMWVMAAGATLAACRYLNFLTLIRSSLDIMRDMVDEGFRRVQRFSTDWHASTFAGATVRNITRGVWGYDTLADTLVLGFLPAIVMLGSVIGLMTWHWRAMGAVIALGAGLYMVLAIGMTLIYIAPATRRSNRYDSKMSGALADAVTCNSVVKSFAAETREEARLGEITTQWRRLVAVTWHAHVVTGFAQNAIALAMQGAVLAIGVWLWSENRASAGDIAYVLTTFTLLNGYLREASNHFRNLLRSVSDMEELANISTLPIGVEDQANAQPLIASAGRIEFQNVGFRYPGKELPLYTDLKLDIPAGAKIGLVGPSGSGKSSFVKLIQRLYDVDSGRILIDGQDIAGVTQRSLREAVTVVQQDPILFHRSLAENIAYAKPGATHAEIVAAAKRANAHDFIAALPQGYDTLVGERGIKLSGGERQRVALARAVLSDARVLILDEATSSLDSISEHLLQEAVEDVTRGRTTIIIAHRLSTVQSVDRILLFDQGRIVEEGDHHALLARPDGHYRQLFETQVLGLIGGEES
ncbi:MAG TPA: ABC transporter ATP-binding protein, partial [Magnetospirillaceae bacterium]|nr:ABC transporter ATP-binding protein [Magnetospirillaceae bacterium]